jgi:hypothetical protein
MSNPNHGQGIFVMPVPLHSLHHHHRSSSIQHVKKKIYLRTFAERTPKIKTWQKC